MHGRAVEIGAAGSMTSASGVTQAELGLRAGEFIAFHRTILEAALEPSVLHVEGLNSLSVEGSITWVRELPCSPLNLFVAGAAGLRQEWIGGFQEARYPVGLGAGVLLLTSAAAGLRIEYRFRRVLHDPVADFSEQRLLLGLSLFLRNRGAPSPP